VKRAKKDYHKDNAIIVFRATSAQVHALQPFTAAARSGQIGGFIIFGQAYLLGDPYEWRDGIEMRFTIRSRAASAIIQNAIKRASRVNGHPVRKSDIKP